MYLNPLLLIAALSGTIAVADTACVADDIISMTPSAVVAAEASPDVTAGRATMADPKRDAETLVSFRKAADQGNPIAEAYLGYLYYMGHGVQQNDQIAADWYGRAAERGFADAQLRLALMLLHGRRLLIAGRSLERDYDEGERWLRRAAKNGHFVALDILADDVRIGRKPENLLQAATYYRRAAEENDRYAINALCGLGTELAPPPEDTAHWCALAAKRPVNQSFFGSVYLFNGHFDNLVDPMLLSSPEIPKLPN
jgi:hypothetical protein